MQLSNLGSAKSLHDKLPYVNGPIRTIESSAEFDNSNKNWVISDGSICWYIDALTKDEVLNILRNRRDKILAELRELGVES